MQVVRPICCGADIHKDIIVATIATSNQNGIAEYIQRKFCTQNYDLINLKSWLKEHNCFEFAMESTGKYWIPIFNVLEDEIKVYVVHPKVLPSFLDTVFLRFLLSLQEKYVSLVKSPDIELNWLLCVLPKETGIKML